MTRKRRRRGEGPPGPLSEPRLEGGDVGEWVCCGVVVSEVETQREREEEEEEEEDALGAEEVSGVGEWESPMGFPASLKSPPLLRPKAHRGLNGCVVEDAAILIIWLTEEGRR